MAKLVIINGQMQVWEDDAIVNPEFKISAIVFDLPQPVLLSDVFKNRSNSAPAINGAPDIKGK